MTNIKELLPHRDPFLYVDKLTEVTPERIVGERTYTEKEYFFNGHFPDYPVVPGVILVETLAQCGGAGMREANVTSHDALFFLASVEKAKFRRQVRPGDTVRLEIEVIRASARTIKQKGVAYVGDEVACEAQWMCIVSQPAG